MAGTTPEELVKYEFAMVPLVLSDSNTSNMLDYASFISDLDVMPPRLPSEQRLSAFQTKQLTQSLQHLEALNTTFQSKLEGSDSTNGHPVAYILSFSSLVNNPLAVKHLSDRLSQVATSGVVDAVGVDGLMKDSEGREAGRMVVINAVVNI